MIGNLNLKTTTTMLIRIDRLLYKVLVTLLLLHYVSWSLLDSYYSSS